MELAVEFRRLGRTELSRAVEIDRRERIDVLYDQHGSQLVARHGHWSASAWDPDGHGEHSVEAKVNTLEHYVDSGGIALGAFASGRLVGIGVVVPHLRPGIAQLAFLHVSAPLRATGIGSRLSEQLEQIARTAGDSDMVVSATPSENTVRFYLGRGFQPMAEPLAELSSSSPRTCTCARYFERPVTSARNRPSIKAVPRTEHTSNDLRCSCGRAGVDGVPYRRLVVPSTASFCRAVRHLLTRHGSPSMAASAGCATRVPHPMRAARDRLAVWSGSIGVLSSRR